MEFLGHFESTLVRNAKTRKLNHIDLVFEDVESYCESSDKLIKNFKDECKFVVADENGERHFISVLDYRFNTKNESIRLFLENYHPIKK